MNQFRLFTQNLRKISLSSLLLILTSSFAILPVQAQSQVPKSEIAQALTDSQKAIITKKAEEFISLLGQNKAKQAREIIPSKLQEYWTAEKIQAVWDTDLIAQFGPYQKILRSKVIDVINADVVKVTVQFSKGTEDVLITFDKQQKPIAFNWPSNKNIEAITKAFANDLGNKNFISARKYLSPLIKAELSPENIQTKWEKLLKRTGPYQKTLSMITESGGTRADQNVVIVKIQFEKVTENLFVFFDENKQIINVDFPE